MVGLIDATFWTSGTVLTDRLAEQNPLGGWFLSAYMFPFLFAGIIVARWGVDVGKKKWAESFLFIGSLFLIMVGYIRSTPLLLIVVSFAGLFVAFAFPLIDSVYTDLVARARKGRKHIMGMSSATFSLAYVVGPIMTGYLSGLMGEKMTFTAIGIIVCIVSIILLAKTPKKLKLPQDEIQSWE
jgi:MFS family permease